MCMTDLDQHEAIQVFVGVDVGPPSTENSLTTT